MDVLRALSRRLGRAAALIMQVEHGGAECSGPANEAMAQLVRG
jgi:hypothetical protein